MIGDLREVYPRLPVLALTTSPESGMLVEAAEAGANEVLTTAVSSEEIVNAVIRLVYNQLEPAQSQIGRTNTPYGTWSRAHSQLFCKAPVPIEKSWLRYGY